MFFLKHGVYYILAGKSTVAGSLSFLFMRIREYVAIMKEIQKRNVTFSDVQHKVKFTRAELERMVGYGPRMLTTAH